MSNISKEKPVEKPLYQAIIQNVCGLEKELLQTETKKFKDKLVNVEEKITRLQKGSSTEYLKDLKKLSIQRENEFQTANINHKYKLDLIEKMYQLEIEAIEKDFTNEVQAIRSSLLLDIEDKLHKLKEDKENVDVSNDYEAEPYARGHPSTRRNRKRGDAEGPKSKRKYNSLPIYVPSLKEDERNSDIKEMKKQARH